MEKIKTYSINEKTRFEDTIKYLTKSEMNSLIEASNFSSVRDKLILSTLYDYGMRVGELVTTKIEDIDFENGFIRIQSFRSKTGRSRTARISKNTLELLREYIHGRKTGYVFRSQGQSGHLSTRRVEQIISKLADKAEIQEIYAEGKDGKKLSRITPHTLRHTHIVHAIMSGVPLAAVMKQVGHADIRTTQIYSTLAPEQVKEAYEKFEDSE